MPSLEALTNEQIGEKLDELTARATTLNKGLEGQPSAEDVKAVQEEMQSLQSQVQPLILEQQKRLNNESIKALTGQVTELTDIVKNLREGARVPEFGSLTGKSLDEQLYQGGERSLFRDIALAAKGGKAGIDASERLEGHLGGKAMTEGDDAVGGYLVKPQFLGELEPVVQPDPLFALIPKVRVSTDRVEFVSVTEGLVAGWTAELAQKPLGADIGFAQLEASIFTAAGLAVASNQLLEDSSIDRLIARELEKRVQAVISSSIVAGTGNGQPRGILNTPAIQDQEYDDASPTVVELLRQIALAIVKVQEEHGEPSHIVLRPSTWAAIITDVDSTGKFTFGSTQNQPSERGFADPFPNKSLLGYPVILSRAVPNNLNDDGTAGGSQTRAIVADFSEQLMLVRNEMTVDKSEHVYFTSNQTVFRGERRVGYTAGRYPKSICTVSGTGMDNSVF